MLRKLIYLVLIVCVSACNSGKLSGNNNSSTSAVTVSVPADFSVDEQSQVNLTGSALGQTSALTYAWTSTPALTITQSSTSAAAASFTAPATTTQTTYTLTLTVTDGNGNTGSGQVVITVNPLNAPPVADIQYNQAANLADKTYPAGGTVTLDGSASSDADAPTGKSAIASYQWQQTEGINVLQGVSLNGPTLSFTAPIGNPGVTLSFKLTVTDQEGATASAEVQLQVLAASDTLPTVDAGVDHQVTGGETIGLYGQVTNVNSQGDPLSYQWLSDGTVNTAIANDGAKQTTAVAPLVTSNQQVTYTLQVTDALGHQVEDSKTVTIVPRGRAKLNDTGVTDRAANQVVSSQSQPDFPGQDGDVGRDNAAQNGTLDKAGKGDAGFDFTRLDSYGDEVSDTASTWRCVRDNLTGLVWEVKDSSGGLQDYRNTYSWYQDTNNGGVAGTLDNASSSCTLTQCNTSAYVSAINTQGLCGFHDWRIPNHQELMSIVHFGKVSPPLIDTGYFPYSTVVTNSNYWYWTSEPSADGAASGAVQNSWVIDFNTGNDNFLNKSNPEHIRLVRAGR